MTFKPVTSIAMFGLDEVQVMHFGAVALSCRSPCGRNDWLFVGVVCSLVCCLVRFVCVFFVVLVMVASFAWHLLSHYCLASSFMFDVH